jgi:hypothetical protein
VNRFINNPGGVVLLALVPILAGGCSDVSPEGERLAAEAYDLLETDYADSEFTGEERRDAFMPRYDSVATEYWGTRAGLEARLQHLFLSTYQLPDEEEEALVDRVVDTVFAHYLDSKHLDVLLDWTHVFNDDQEAAYFHRMREESPHAEVRAAAIFEPARLRNRLLKRDRLDDSLNARAEVEADLRLLMDEYGDIPKGGSTYGILADAHLNAHSREALEVGQPAPETVGVTVDGEEILLSQFKGKVTVFYFWGDW